MHKWYEKNKSKLDEIFTTLAWAVLIAITGIGFGYAWCYVALKEVNLWDVLGF